MCNGAWWHRPHTCSSDQDWPSHLKQPPVPCFSVGCYSLGLFSSLVSQALVPWWGMRLQRKNIFSNRIELVFIKKKIPNPANYKNNDIEYVHYKTYSMLSRKSDTYICFPGMAILNVYSMETLLLYSRWMLFMTTQSFPLKRFNKFEWKWLRVIMRSTWYSCVTIWSYIRNASDPGEASLPGSISLTWHERHLQKQCVTAIPWGAH